MVGAEWWPAVKLPATIKTEVDQSEKSLTRKEAETSEILHPKAYWSQLPTIGQALETVGLIPGRGTPIGFYSSRHLVE